MDQPKLLQAIQDVTTLYNQYLQALDAQLGREHARDRAIAVGGVYTARAELERLLRVAQSELMKTTLAQLLGQIRHKVKHLDSRRAALLGRMGAREVQRDLLEALRIYSRAYQETVRQLAIDHQKLSSEEFEEYQMDDQLIYAEMLSHRDLIDLLLRQVSPPSPDSDVMEYLEEADQILREGGRVYLQPLLRAGFIQRGREARFEPEERWWHYLDMPQGIERRDGFG